MYNALEICLYCLTCYGRKFFNFCYYQNFASREYEVMNYWKLLSSPHLPSSDLIASRIGSTIRKLRSMQISGLICTQFARPDIVSRLISTLRTIPRRKIQVAKEWGFHLLLSHLSLKGVSPIRSIVSCICPEEEFLDGEGPKGRRVRTVDWCHLPLTFSFSPLTKKMC